MFTSELMNLEQRNILNEVTQTLKDKYSMHALIHRHYCQATGDQEYLYKKEKQNKYLQMISSGRGDYNGRTKGEMEKEEARERISGYLLSPIETLSNGNGLHFTE